MTPRPSTHALTLTSTKTAEILRASVGTNQRAQPAILQLYKAECSCGKWGAQDKPATQARALHAQHLQEMLGPDAVERRRNIAYREHLRVEHKFLRDLADADLEDFALSRTGYPPRYIHCDACTAYAIAVGFIIEPDHEVRL